LSKLAPPAVASFLAQTSVLKGVPAEVLGKLAPHVEQQTVPAGKPILGPGAVVTTLGFLAAGRASMQVVDALTGQRSTIEEVHPGDVFGEIALMLGTASPVVVTADEECDVVAIQRAHFEKIAAAVPDAMQALAKRVCARFVKLHLLGSKKTGKSVFPDPPTGSMPSVASPPAPASVAVPPTSISKGIVPFVETASYSIGPKVLELIPTRTILEYRLLPLELRGRTLVVGMVSPHSIQAKEELRRVLHSADPEIVAISADDYANAVLRLKLDFREQRAASAGAMSGGRLVRPQFHAELRKEAEKQLQVMIGDEAVVLLERVLAEALDRGASDVHIEPDVTGVRIRFRIQGMLQDRKEMVPASLAAPLVARIKVLADLDITERRVPQDGRIVASFGPREVNFRVSTMLAARGEKVVLRILDPSDVMRPLEHIFHDPRALELVQRAIGAHHGAIIIAGATGSGKSSTLYSLLNARRLARPDNNLVTVEDPIEFLVPGFTQSPINPKAGVDYPVALRALMRQDPDVIMVGELRDATTVQMLLEAALTGHLAISTIHASNAISCFQRLAHFGVDELHIGQALNLVIVQKLARKLCSACTKDEDVAPQLVEAMIARKLLLKGATPKLPRAVGCDACNHTGYRGRVPVHEIAFFDDETRLAFEGGTAHSEILAKAESAGTFLNFAHSARLLMAKHLLTPADALSVTD
jgi:type IV pilus assembly protein PilB